MGNVRGTEFSRQHKTLNPNVSELYWNFSFHEIGKYDLPAIIDFALAKTNQSSLHYIGHSQGCSAFFVMTTIRPEYNVKIATMTAMAPAVFLRHSIFSVPPVIYGLDQIVVNFYFYKIKLRNNYFLFIFAGFCRFLKIV